MTVPCITGILINPLFYSILLMDIVYHETTLRQAVSSIFSNLRSILFTFILAVVIIYYFAIVGYILLQDDFLIEIAPTHSMGEIDTMKERSCDTLWMCFVTTLNQGLRNGGGIGDVLRQPSRTERLDLIFGVIVDTFA